MTKKITNGLIILLSLVIVGIVSYLFLFSGKIENVREIESIVLNKNSITLEIGASEKIEISILPEDAINQTILWESDDSNIASVNDDGIVTANNSGNTVINVKSKNGNIQSKCFVYVEKKKIEDIQLDKTNLNLDVGEKELLNVSIIPEDLQDDRVIWSSSNPGVASVNENGEVEGLKEGTTTITAMSSDGSKSVNCVVNVTNPVIAVTGVSLRTNNLIIVNGASEVLSTIVSPNNATDKSVSWTSSNPSIVSVESGKLTAKGAGEATITVKTTDGGKVATCNVKVLDIKTHNQQNDAITYYLKNGNIVSSDSKNNCKKKSCTAPIKYNTSLSGDINVYQYNSSNNTKELVETVNSNNLNYYLLPGKTYYLESKSNPNKVEVVKITGTVRVISGSVSNFRDLGGWETEEGTKVKYGKVYRSAATDHLSEKIINILNLRRIVDLRAGFANKNVSEASKKIRKVVGIVNYTSDSRVKNAVKEVMKSVVEGKNVIFNCAIGRDRTGTVAFIIEGILGVTDSNKNRDYELSYYIYHARTSSSLSGLKSQLGCKNNKCPQEIFAKWYIASSSNKSSDIELINNFRKKMIDGNPKEYKLSGNELLLS